MMERLLSWEATLAIVLGLPGIGLAFLALNDFRIAKLCFLGAAADAIGFMVWQTSQMQINSTLRTIFVFVGVGAIGVLADQSLKYVNRKREQKDKRQKIIATINTRIVGRLHARTPAPPPGHTVNVNFAFQEVFYEYGVTLTANGPSVASLKIDYLQPNDIYRVEPESAMAERVAETALGFKIPSAKASHFALIVRADDLTETQPLTVTIRRSITSLPVDSDLVKLSYVRSSTSTVEQAQYDLAGDVTRLKHQAKVISEWKYPPREGPLPIHPPGELPRGWMESILEASCKNEDCTQLTMSNLVAQWNRI